MTVANLLQKSELILPSLQVGDLNSDHQDRDRSCDDEHEDVRPPRTSSSGAVRTGLRREGKGVRGVVRKDVAVREGGEGGMQEGAAGVRGGDFCGQG